MCSDAFVVKQYTDVGSTRTSSVTIYKTTHDVTFRKHLNLHRNGCENLPPTSQLKFRPSLMVDKEEVKLAWSTELYPSS